LYIKTLSLRGFKTFADKTDIELAPTGGVCAIVGPNGCGKSNIVDSIRWVLGEQSSKSIRTENLEEVIFAGSNLRKPLSLAEVALLLENEDGLLPIEFSEVSIKRRVFRDSESEFFINKSPCRLKDIKDLFLDTGLGGGSYSIISQGQVDAILSSKPEDRRAIFEEAAGINKYKTRKSAAERKLLAAEQNLLRVSDLKSEVSQQLSTLEEQAQKASRYVELKARLKEVEIGLCKRQLGRFWELKAQLLSQIEEFKKQAEQNLAGQRQLEQQKLEMRQAIRDVEQKERDLRAGLAGELDAPLKMQILNANAELADQKNALRDIEEKIRFADFEIDRNARSVQSLTERTRTLNCEIPGVTTFVESTRTKLREIKDRTAGLSSQKAGFEEEEERTLESILTLVKDIYAKLSGLSSGFAEKFLSGAEGPSDKSAAILSLGENIGGMLQELKNGTDTLEALLHRKREFKEVAGEEAVHEADLRVELAAQEVRLSNLKSEAERAVAEAGLMIRGSELRREEIGQAEVEKNKLLEKINQAEREIGELDAQLSFSRSAVNQKLEELADQREKLENELDTLDRSGGAGDGQAVNESILKAEIALAKLEGENLSVVNKLMEEYGMTAEEAQAAPYEIASLAKAKEEIDTLRFSLRELEPVNLLAIDEFKRVSERVTFIDTQQADLVAAKDSLKTLVAELDARALESFLQTIETVNRNFQEIFASLFEGGEAKIVLGEGVDALSSGIEIIARPRGRKWLNLSLLSGGEKSLTAIAILFSLLKTHPSPFCFLDEVDAALDDANVRRFTKMLREFAKTIQMVVITHNKRTMEIADVIYGITMEEPGISKVISMKMSAVAAAPADNPIQH